MRSDGDGDGIDVTPPELLSPAEGAWALSLTTTLAWSARLGAASYTVVVEDASTGASIADSPFTVTAPETSLPVVLPDARTYSWRVESNVMEGSAVEATFHAMDDAVYVYCAQDTACVPDDGVGNKAAPFKTVGAALIAAAELDIPTVRVAARGGSQAYEEAVDLMPGISVWGGYLPDFAESGRWDFDAELVPPSTHETVIHREESYTVTAFLVQAATPTRFDGFTVRGGTLGATYAMYVSSCDASLTVSHCAIEGGAASEYSYGLYTELTDLAAGGPLFERNDIRADAAPNGSYAVFNERSRPTIRSSNIVGAMGNGPSFALYNHQSTAMVLQCVIIAGSSAWSDVHAVFEESSDSSLVDNVIIGGSASDAGSSWGLRGLPFDGTARNNLIIGGEATGTGDSYGLELLGEATVHGNTIVGGPVSTGKSYGLYHYGGPNVIVDNIIVTIAPSGERYGIFDRGEFPEFIPTHTHNCVWASGATTYSGMIADPTEIEADPLFVSGVRGDYYLSAVAAGQLSNSPCRDAGSDSAASLGLDTWTTSTNGAADTGVVDLGVHFAP